MTTLPPNRSILRGDHERLVELITECSQLNTHDVPKLCDGAARVWSYARSLAREIGMDLQNPPIPKVCNTTAGSCRPGCNCDPLEQARESEATAEANALRAVRNQGTL